LPLRFCGLTLAILQRESLENQTGKSACATESNLHKFSHEKLEHLKFARFQVPGYTYIYIPNRRSVGTPIQGNPYARLAAKIDYLFEGL
jgi:hypothetical protein